MDRDAVEPSAVESGAKADGASRAEGRRHVNRLGADWLTIEARVCGIGMVLGSSEAHVVPPVEELRLHRQVSLCEGCERSSTCAPGRRGHAPLWV